MGGPRASSASAARTTESSSVILTPVSSSEFRNDGCSDWQWRDLCSGATTFDLEGAPVGLRPIVQPIPDFHFNTLLAHVFEARVGGGSLLVCGYDLTSNLDRRPAASLFRRSLFRYAASPAFQPTAEMPLPWVQRLCGFTGLRRLGAKVIKVDSEDRANGNLAANLLDGDSATFWHTRWQPQNEPMPHEVVIDLGRALDLRGLTCLPRQDQANGRIAEADLFCRLAPDNWGPPVASVHWTNHEQLETVQFPQPIRARYVRLLVNSEVNGNSFAALAELDILPSTE